jgi:hypothetical protein
MRVIKHAAWPFFLAGLFGFLLAGCATKVGDDLRIPVGELALHDSIPKAESIAKLELHVSAARNENMPFLAPHHFREAADILDEAQRSSPRDVSNYDLAKADVLIDKGEAVIDNVKDRLGKELELKRKLDNLRANEIYPWQYRENIYALSNLIEKVELGRAGNIEKDKEKLNKSMQELYDKTVEYTSSHQSPTIDQGTKNKEGGE